MLVPILIVRSEKQRQGSESASKRWFGLCFVRENIFVGTVTEKGVTPAQGLLKTDFTFDCECRYDSCSLSRRFSGVIHGPRKLDEVLPPGSACLQCQFGGLLRGSGRFSTVALLGRIDDLRRRRHLLNVSPDRSGASGQTGLETRMLRQRWEATDMFFILLIATLVLWTFNLRKGWVL